MPQRKLHRPLYVPEGYEAIDLKDTTNPYVTEAHKTRINANFEPIYIVLGRNLIQLTRQADDSRALVSWRPSQSYTFINTENDGRLYVPSDKDSTYDNITIIGRHATPELQLDGTASRRHLRFESMANIITLQDLDSKNGTVVSTRDMPEPVTRIL